MVRSGCRNSIAAIYFANSHKRRRGALATIIGQRFSLRLDFTQRHRADEIAVMLKMCACGSGMEPNCVQWGILILFIVP